MQLRFGITCHVCDDGWSVVYGGVRFMQRVILGTTGEAQRGKLRRHAEIIGTWSILIVTSVTSWRGAIERCRELQSRQGVQSGRQGRYQLGASMNGTDVAERCICVRHAGRIVCKVM